MEKEKNIVYVALSRFLSFAIGIVRGILVPGYLGPRLYGVIGLLKLVKVILGFSSLGMDQGYMRLKVECQQNRAANKISQKALEDNVFTFLIIAGVSGTAATIFLPLFVPIGQPDLHDIIFYCFFITAFHHFFQLTGLFFVKTIHQKKNIRFVSAMNILQPLLALVLILATLFRWNIYGVVTADFISIAVVQMLYFVKSGVRPHFKIHLHEFPAIFKYSFPFFLTAVSFYLFRFADRTVIATFLTLREMGLYSFAVGIADSARMLGLSINEVNLPYVLEKISKEENLFSLAGVINSYSSKLMFVVTSIALVSIFLAPFIRFILPQYGEAIFIVKLLFINIVIKDVPFFHAIFLGTPRVNKQHWINGAMFTAGVFNLLLSILFIKMGYGLKGVVVATVMSHLGMAVFYILGAEKYFLEKKDWFFYAKAFFSLFILGGFCLVQRIYPAISLTNIILNTAFFILFAIVFVWFFRTEARDIAVSIKTILAKK